MAIVKEVKTPLGSYSLTTLFAFLVAACCIVAVATSRISLYLQRRKFKVENGCKPPATFQMRDRLFGSDQVRNRMKAAKEHKLLEYSQNNFRNVGKTWGASVMGQGVIMTIEPQNVKTVLSLKFEDFGLGNREKTLGRLLGRGIFTTDGEPWAHSRAMIRPNFTRSQVADLAAFERHIQTLFKILPEDGSTVDLQEMFFKFTIDSATEFLFGQSTGTLNASLKEINTSSASDFAKAFNVAQSSVAQRGRVGNFRFLLRDKAGDDAIRICHEFVDQFVDEAVQYREKLDAGHHDDKKEKYVFLHELAKTTTDKRRLRDELLNVLLAGRDTTASLLSNMWFMLAKHPEVFAKLKKEVDETLDGDLPTYEILRNMKYLKYCMNECKLILPISTSPQFRPIGLTLLPPSQQPSVSTPSSPPTLASPTKTPYCLSAADPTANRPYSSRPAPSLVTGRTRCIVGRTSSGQTQKTLCLSDGNTCGRAGSICRSMADHVFAWANSMRLPRRVTSQSG